MKRWPVLVLPVLVLPTFYNLVRQKHQHALYSYSVQRTPYRKWEGICHGVFRTEVRAIHPSWRQPSIPSFACPSSSPSPPPSRPHTPQPTRPHCRSSTTPTVRSREGARGPPHGRIVLRRTGTAMAPRPNRLGQQARGSNASSRSPLSCRCWLALPTRSL